MIDKKLKKQFLLFKKKISRTLVITVLLFLAIVSATLSVHFAVKEFSIHWTIFTIIFLCVPNLMCYANKFYDAITVFEKNRNLRFRVDSKKGLLLYWLFDCVYMAAFNNWLALIFVFGILSLLIIISELIKNFLSDELRQSGLNIILCFNLLLGLALTIYLIYVIPDKLIRDITTTIIAAVYGGLITLLGVAWTIHKNEKDKKAEEIEKAKPYLQLISDNHIPDKDQKFDAKVTISFSNNYKDEQVVLNSALPHYLHIKNVGSLLIIEAIKLDSTYKSCKKTLVAENNNLLLCLQSFSFNVERETIELILYGRDKLKNYYSFTIENKIKKHENIFNWKLEYIGMPIKVEESEMKEIYKELEKEKTENA